MFGFLPADIVSQILNFGAAGAHRHPGRGRRARRTTTSPTTWWRTLRHVPGLVDLRLGQVFNQPELRVATDRSRAQQLGISQHDIANNLLLTLSGSGQIAPTFWLNPTPGCSTRWWRRRRSTA